MAGFLIPLAGLALGALGRLVNSRRQARAGASFGTAINTQPQGPPTNSVSTAATSDPTPPISARVTANRAARAEATRRSVEAFQQQPTGGGTNKSVGSRGEQGRAGIGLTEGPISVTSRSPNTQVDAQKPLSVTSGPSAAEMGAASVARSRRRNREQQATLSGAAVTSR